MRTLSFILLLMNLTTANAQLTSAKTVKRGFHQVTSVAIEISADPAIVWALLTNASDFSRWNSTIVSLEGDIEVGEKIRLKSTLDEKRTFKIKVKALTPEQAMTWGDGQGTRWFRITETEKGVHFEMEEKIGGLMYPMYKKYLPPFEENFNQWVLDLKREAEKISSTN
ncbi:MAG: SRPBCC domain-containing protein [Bacteroidota bacterium]